MAKRADEEQSGALAGVRLVEFSSAMAGPWIGRFMAWCGAEVIRVESRGYPDVVRLYVSPRAPEQGTQPQGSPWFTDWNAGKRFVALDLRNPQGVELAKRLVARADVVVENQAAGVLDRLGLGYTDLRRIKPDLVHLSSSGYGDTGPDRSYVSWGPNIETLSGLSGISGFADSPCTNTQFAYPDTASALHGLFAVMCALDHRERTGQGQHISLSQLESTVSLIGPLVAAARVEGREPAKLGNRSPDSAPSGCYPCRGDDRWVAISVEDEAGWRSLCRALARPDWLEDPALGSSSGRTEHADLIDAGIAAWTRERDAYEVMHALQAAGVAAGVVQNVEDLALRDRQLEARGFFETIPHSLRGEVRATGIPLGLTGTPGRSGLAGAALGQDNAYVFGELLGMSDDEIGRAIRAGAIETQV
ncbi:MAG: CaiB/BaiF CoA transferase family protein [Myxococcota bacterium]